MTPYRRAQNRRWSPDGGLKFTGAVSSSVTYLPPSAASERALVEGLRQGELTAYRQLYELFAPQLRRMLDRVYQDASLADDVVQATFLIVFRKIGQFDGRASLLTWVTRIALREAARARGRAEPVAAPAPAEAELAVEASPEEEAALRRDAAMLAKLISQLPDSKRIALLLFEVEGLSVQEIADVLETPRGTILARLSRTRAELRTAMLRADATVHGAATAEGKATR